MKLLHINASPRGADSHSLALVERFIDLLGQGRALEVDRIDLFAEDLPPFGTLATGAKMALFAGRDQSEAETAAWEAIRRIFDRFAAAETYVLNVPIWNNGIPYVLKHYVDLVTQPGWSFGFDPDTGYTGLMGGRKAVIVHASGVWHDTIQGNFGSDFSTPYLVDWLKLIGVTEIAHLRVQPTVLTGDLASTRLAAEADAARLAAAF